MNLPLEYWLHHTLFYTLLLLIHYLCGLLVIHRGIKVNYTRKVNHFAFFFLPVLLQSVVAYSFSAATFIMDIVFVFVFLTVFIAPIRTRFKMVTVMFRSIDRPEDRPLTLTWLYTQFLASYLVLIPLLAYFSHHDILPLIMIILLANGIGDGLAEPVGIRFGKRKYTTHALFTCKKYVRSYIGSTCVFVATFVSILVFHQHFNTIQLIAALVTIPLLITLAEAFSPHTWDSPLIYGVGGLALIG
ncbi:MAG: hypothetical protein KDF59_16555, partial [Nitrosomonas sp.]|nr:hypothetical protein [Nitrosomonas sp.]